MIFRRPWPTWQGKIPSTQIDTAHIVIWILRCQHAESTFQSCAVPLPASLADFLLFLGLSSVLAALLSFPWSLQSKFSFHFHYFHSMIHVSCSYSFFLLQPYMLQTKLVLSTCPHHFTSRAQLHPFWLPLLCPGTCEMAASLLPASASCFFPCPLPFVFPSVPFLLTYLSCSPSQVI
jgi:hypothetical protein